MASSTAGRSALRRTWTDRELRSTSEVLRLLKLALAAAGQPIQEIHFEGEKIHKRDLISFAYVIREMRSLEVLGVNGLIFGDDEFLGKFLRSLYRLRFLKSLSLDHMGGRIDRNTFSSMVKRILKDGVMKKFHCTTEWTFKFNGTLRGFPGINLKDVLEKNPTIGYIDMPKDIRQGDSDINVLKWI